MSAVLRTRDLGLRYGARWALRGCDIDLPAGRIVALMGPNGAGKTTLLHLVAGLLRPSEGSIEVLGSDPVHDASLLARVGLVAQDMPLYRSFSVRDTLHLGRRLNPRWDETAVVARLAELDIPMDQKVGSLSGGQRAQVALAVALAKRPELLLLDEPLASLDPLARRELLRTLMVSAADGGITIVLSSHLLTDLERVCDHLLVVARGRLQLTGEIDSLLAEHAVLVGPPPTAPIAGVASVIDEVGDARQTTMTVRLDGPVHDPRWLVEPVGLEDLVLAYLAGGGSTPGSTSGSSSARALDVIGGSA